MRAPAVTFSTHRPSLFPAREFSPFSLRTRPCSPTPTSSLFALLLLRLGRPLSSVFLCICALPFDSAFFFCGQPARCFSFSNMQKGFRVSSLLCSFFFSTSPRSFSAPRDVLTERECLIVGETKVEVRFFLSRPCLAEDTGVIAKWDSGRGSTIISLLARYVYHRVACLSSRSLKATCSLKARF